MSESDPYYPSNEGDAARSKPTAFSARVPESVSRGVFSTGAIIVTGASEFVVDFILRMGRPHQVVARIILPHGAMARVVEALRENLNKYEEKFGPCPRLPKPDKKSKKNKPTIQEIYDDLRLPDEVLSGSYANGVMIGHSMSEFSFDFVTNFFPNSCVSQRVFLAAGQVPSLLESLEGTYNGLQKRLAEQQKKQAGDDVGGEGDDKSHPAHTDADEEAKTEPEIKPDITGDTDTGTDAEPKE